MRSFITLTIAWVARSPLPKRMSSTSSLSASSSTQYTATGMPILPLDVVKYSQVPKAPAVFTKDKIPKGLLRQHTTKSGTWGVIRVSKGQLRYTIQEPNTSVHLLDADIQGIIEPTMHHQVAPVTDDVEFVVEFHRVPNTGPVDETRE